MGKIASGPRVHYACSVDTEQYAVARVLTRMVDVDEGVDTGQGVSLRNVADTVNHAAGSACSGNLTGIQDIEGKCVVGLVPRPVRNRGSLLDSKFPECLPRCL